MMQAKIESILRPDVFRIVFDSNSVPEMLFDRRILYSLENADDLSFIVQKIRDLIQNRNVDILRSFDLSNGVKSGRIYIDGKHLSAYLK